MYLVMASNLTSPQSWSDSTSWKIGPQIGISRSPWARKGGVNEGWIFPSKRAQSGYITDREVSKQWLEAKRLAGIPQSVVLYCARHRFSTDAMEGTGNVMAVMDAMGHGSVNTTRIYTHSNVQQIREAIERRKQLCATPVEAGHKSGHSRLK